MTYLTNFTGPDPPEWHNYASVAYYKDKVYYLGGLSSRIPHVENQVDVRRSSESS